MSKFILHSIVLSAFILLAVQPGRTQEASGNPIEKRGFYRTMHKYGGGVHSRGIQGFYRYGWRKTGFRNHIYHVEFLNVNHPKQEKVEVGPNYQRYFEGKLNSVFFLRNSYGWQQTLFDKEVNRGVRVSYYFLFGPTLAFAKPIYLMVRQNISSPSPQRYNYDQHSGADVVLGRASFLLGLNETRIHAGLHTKFGFNFEYSGDDESIKSIETGVQFDAFARQIPILAVTYNDQFFLTFYLSLQLGKRYL